MLYRATWRAATGLKKAFATPNLLLLRQSSVIPITYPLLGVPSSRPLSSTPNHQEEPTNFSSSQFKWGALMVGGLMAGSVLAGGRKRGGVWAEEEKEEKKEDLPVYSLEEVAKHNKPETRMWVIFKGEVYDITDFAEGHPGGKEKISLAAGGDVEDFWFLYPIHYNNAAVRDVLDQYRIGKLDPKDLVPREKDSKDPFANDPVRSKALVAHRQRPFNAEVPSPLLTQNYITPNPLWFTRQHHPVPQVDLNTFRLGVSIDDTIEGEHSSLSLSVDDLKKMKSKTLIVSLQCTGNRRKELTDLSQCQGLSWNLGAISTAEFKGVLLSDLLANIGVSMNDTKGAQHIHFGGLDEPFMSSIPIRKAVDLYGDVLIAYEMNGEDIPRDHGFPLRAVVPGHAGVRSAKWVSNIVVSKKEAPGMWTSGMSYKFLPFWIKDLKGVQNIEKEFSIQEIPITSFICDVNNGAPISEYDDEIEIKGIAYSGGGRSVISLGVTPDGGKTWIPGVLEEGKDQIPGQAWAWTFWSCTVPITKELKESGKLELASRAVDSSCSSQPERTDLCWNIRGVLNNSWHRVTFPIEKD